MKLYGSFLVRCWVIWDENGEQRTVFDVEHIQQGERMRVGNLEEAFQWMMKMMEAWQPEQPGSEPGAEPGSEEDHNRKGHS